MMTYRAILRKIYLSYLYLSHDWPYPLQAFLFRRVLHLYAYSYNHWNSWVKQRRVGACSCIQSAFFGLKQFNLCKSFQSMRSDPQMNLTKWSSLTFIKFPLYRRLTILHKIHKEMYYNSLYPWPLENAQFFIWGSPGDLL